MSATPATHDLPEGARPAPQRSTLDILRRGLALSPELRHGLPVTLLLAAVMTVGRVVILSLIHISEPTRRS